jgi:hypothetical protein
MSSVWRSYRKTSLGATGKLRAIGSAGDRRLGRGEVGVGEFVLAATRRPKSSPTVGMSGSVSERIAVATARSLPALMYSMMPPRGPPPTSWAQP